MVEIALCVTGREKVLLPINAALALNTKDVLVKRAHIFTATKIAKTFSKTMYRMSGLLALLSRVVDQTVQMNAPRLPLHPSFSYSQVLRQTVTTSHTGNTLRGKNQPPSIADEAAQ